MLTRGLSPKPVPSSRGNNSTHSDADGCEYAVCVHIVLCVCVMRGRDRVIYLFFWEEEESMALVKKKHSESDEANL